MQTNTHPHPHYPTLHIHSTCELVFTSFGLSFSSFVDASTFLCSLHRQPSTTDPAPYIFYRFTSYTTPHTTPDNRNILSRYSCDLMWVSTLPLYLFGQLPRCQQTTSRTFNTGSVEPGGITSKCTQHNYTNTPPPHHHTELLFLWQLGYS